LNSSSQQIWEQHFSSTGISLGLHSSVAKGGGGLQPPPLARRKKEGKNALSAHLRSLFAAIGVSNDF